MAWSDVKEEVLIACKRYCCICEHYKGINIEVHHIIPKSQGGTDTLDNAIPLCFDCHSMIGSYNPKHPKGNRFSSSELKHIRDEFYEKVKSWPRNNDATHLVGVASIASSSDVSDDNTIAIIQWRELSLNLNNYQHIIDYAYAFWEGNLKRKYNNASMSEELLGNPDYQGLQDEIDKYGGTLYRDIFEKISAEYPEYKCALSDIITRMSIDLSKTLFDLLTSYLDAMTFHYQSDGEVGLVNYYWSSFFVCLNRNYGRIRELKNMIDEKIRAEYRDLK